VDAPTGRRGHKNVAPAGAGVERKKDGLLDLVVVAADVAAVCTEDVELATQVRAGEQVASVGVLRDQSQRLLPEADPSGRLPAGSNPHPNDDTIATAMNGNLCRCGTYPRIRKAIRTAAGSLATGKQPGVLTARAEIEVPPLSSEDAADPVHPYIRIREDGTVLVFSSQIEMGQGIFTGLATIVADELDADFDSIRVVHSPGYTIPNGDIYGNLTFGGLIQITGGSTSTQAIWARYRQVAAIARARLVSAAAASWQVPEAEIAVESGELSHASGKTATFGEMALSAERRAVSDGVEPKERSAYRLIGREGLQRVDTAAKILGQARYSIDVATPRMLTAVVLHPLRFGATVASVDDEATLQEPGVAAVVQISAGVCPGRDVRRCSARPACDVGAPAGTSGVPAWRARSRPYLSTRPARPRRRSRSPRRPSRPR
jgi:hypothetical protein